jgi:hypothetical protein
MKMLAGTVVLMFALASQSVSRIGGGSVGSSASLFEMKVPEEFQNMDQIQNMVLATGPVVFTQGGVIEQTLQIRDYQDHFSQLNMASRADTVEHFVKTGWTRKDFPQNPCVEVFEYKNDSATGWVATWGAGRGVTMNAPRTVMTEEALNRSLQELELLPGACAWP